MLSPVPTYLRHVVLDEAELPRVQRHAHQQRRGHLLLAEQLLLVALDLPHQVGGEVQEVVHGSGLEHARQAQQLVREARS
jgi:hypothetical protein